MSTSYTNPENSWTKRFAAKKEAQLEPGTGYDSVYPPKSEIGGPGTPTWDAVERGMENAEPGDPTNDPPMIEDDEALQYIEKLVPYAQNRFGDDFVDMLKQMHSTILEVRDMDKEEPETDPMQEQILGDESLGDH